MKNKKLLMMIGGALLLAAGVMYVLTKPVGNPDGPSSREGRVYCGADGTLSDTMPIQSHRSYCLLSDREGGEYPVRTAVVYAFSIVDDRGETLKDFEIAHTKLMHVIVVRKDLASFQHVHPEFDARTGMFTLPDLTFLADGAYRIFADFIPAGGQMGPAGERLGVTVSDDVAVGVGAAYRPEPIGPEMRTKNVDGVQIMLSDARPFVAEEESVFRFTIQEDGKPVTDLQEYLGALGHAVILREDTLDFIHSHPEDASKPQDGSVEFSTVFPSAGKYKIFAQFQKDGEVIMADFVVSVAPGEGGSDTDAMMYQY